MWPLRFAIAACLLLASCSADRAGWAPRGSFRKLFESPSLQIRRGSQVLDPRTGELVLPWVGVRAPENQPEVLACSLVLFDDKDGDRRPDPGEILASRESLTPSRKVLFDDVRVRAPQGSRLRARFDARTETESSLVVWDLATD